jgi:4-phytase/acid phosphatase
VRDNRLGFLSALLLLAALPVAAAPAQLKYVVIVTRHGVRSPTWDQARLNQFSAEPWPEWGVAPGDLTSHGHELMKLMGAYYREWLANESLLAPRGCSDASRIYIWADTSERTIETGHALAESLSPGCAVAVHSQLTGKSDPLFAGVGVPDLGEERRAVGDRIGSSAAKLTADHKQAFDALNFILSGYGSAPSGLLNTSTQVSVSAKGKSADLDGPFSTASSLSEDLLLEYANGMQGRDLGWGRLTSDNLLEVLELHQVYTDLTRRTLYIARTKGSNLLNHVLDSIEQAASGKSVVGAIGDPNDRVLILSGHDTNLSNISGMLGLSWKLPGYQQDDTPPGGALIFSLWQDPATGEFSVRTEYVAQTLNQMRNSTPLSRAAPPAKQDVAIPSCAVPTSGGCSLETFKTALHKAIDPAFTEKTATKSREP